MDRRQHLESAGKIIFLNGASSAGKSTLAAALQARLAEPFWHVSIDHFIAARMLPKARLDSGDFAWGDLRPAFFEGFHRCLPALAGAGNNLIVEYIFETENWTRDVLKLLDGFDVFFVGVHCPLEKLERREIARGDRKIGDAWRDFEVTHRFCKYDLEVDSTASADANTSRIIEVWLRR